MIYPKLWIERRAQLGNDTYGQPMLGPVQRERVAPVKLIFNAVHTTVRTDSGGSHGHAYEDTANVVLLALRTSGIALGDILTVQGNEVRVIGRQERYRPNGVLDHLEISCTAWK
jgi:hypothetical protein